MAKTKTLQTNFSAGELDPDVHMRQDTEQYQNGAKSLHNRRCLIGGGTVRRPGTTKQVNPAATARTESWIVNRATQYVVAFSDGAAAFYARNIATGALTAAGTLSTCPWTGDIFREMSVVQSANTMFLTHTGMPPQVITRTGASTWVRTAFAFATGPAGRPEQPYLKFAPADMTLAASDVTGSVTLTTSDDWFVSDHVGTYIRYHKRALLITAVTNPTTATATVIETLPETYDLTVSSSVGFSVGEVIEDTLSGAKGIVTSIPDGTSIVIVLKDTLIPPQVSDPGAALGAGEADFLVGPYAKTEITAVATTTNAAVTDWDEQMFSAVWGYPSCVELHRNRLLFAGHESAPDYLIGSSLISLYIFDAGDGSDADAILESIGDNAASRIVSLHSAEQLIVCTDSGPYYVPESAASPFRPTSIAFFPFGSPWPLSPTVRPIPFDDGVLLLSGSLVIKARPQGGDQQAWKADEVSTLSAHLFSDPVGMTAVLNFAGGTERYAVFCNDDGTLAVMQLVETQKVRNVTPWATDRGDDTFNSVVGIEGDLYVHCTRSVDGSTVQTIERFDQTMTLDYTVTEAVLADIGNTFADGEANVVTDSGYHLGTWPLALEAEEVPAGPYNAGFFFSSEIELLPPVIEGEDGSTAGDMMRICEAYVHVRASARFAANGHELQAYQVTDDLTEPPPEKEGVQRFQFLGWRREPTVTITQTDPLPLKVLAVKTLVAY